MLETKDEYLEEGNTWDNDTSKVFGETSAVGQSLKINVSFDPYSRDVSYDCIIDFIKSDSMICRSTENEK